MISELSGSDDNNILIVFDVLFCFCQLKSNPHFKQVIDEGILQTLEVGGYPLKL
jgi:hypothetical protein